MNKLSQDTKATKNKIISGGDFAGDLCESLIYLIPIPLYIAIYGIKVIQTSWNNQMYII